MAGIPVLLDLDLLVRLGSMEVMLGLRHYDQDRLQVWHIFICTSNRGLGHGVYLQLS